MSLRTKVLCLLLALTVLPLVGLRLRGQRVFEDVTRTLADNSAQTLQEKAMAQTLAQVRGQAALLRREGELLEQTIRLQALEVEKALPQPGTEGFEKAHLNAARELRDIVANQSTALLDGRTFPRESFDHHIPAWFDEIKGSSGPVWSLPRPDPEKGRIPLTVSISVRDREGRFAGATAITADLDLKNRRNGLTVLSPMVSVYLVHPEELGSRGKGLLVLGRNEAHAPAGRHSPKPVAVRPSANAPGQDQDVAAKSPSLDAKRASPDETAPDRAKAPGDARDESGTGTDKNPQGQGPPTSPNTRSDDQAATAAEPGQASNTAATPSPAGEAAGLQGATQAAPDQGPPDSARPTAVTRSSAVARPSDRAAPSRTEAAPGSPNEDKAESSSPPASRAEDSGAGTQASTDTEAHAAAAASDWFSLDSPEDQARLLAAVKAHEPGRFVAMYRHRSHLVAYAPLGVHDVTLVYVLPMEEITAEAQAARDFIDRTVSDQFQATGYMAGLALVAVILVAWLVARGLTGPILQLDRAARRVAAGDLDVKVHPCGGGEIESLGRAFNLMVPELREKVRLSQAMFLARQVQHGLLPERLPQPPGLDVAGLSQPCDETGGDYFDAVENARATQGVTALVVGDVSGHGVDAALYMTTARAYLRLRAQQAGDPAQVVGDVNRFLTRDTHGSGRFMTLFYLEVDDSGLRYVRAGHDPALVYDPAGDAFEELTGQGPPLGIGADFDYECVSRPPLAPGQVLLMVSDGLWEARNPAGEMFGKERVRQALRQHAHLGARALLDALLGAQAVFREGRPVRDDVTLLAVKAVGKVEEEEKEEG